MAQCLCLRSGFDMECLTKFSCGLDQGNERQEGVQHAEAVPSYHAENRLAFGQIRQYEVADHKSCSCKQEGLETLIHRAVIRCWAQQLFSC